MSCLNYLIRNHCPACHNHFKLPQTRPHCPPTHLLIHAQCPRKQTLKWGIWHLLHDIKYSTLSHNETRNYFTWTRDSCNSLLHASILSSGGDSFVTRWIWCQYWRCWSNYALHKRLCAPLLFNNRNRYVAIIHKWILKYPE